MQNLKYIILFALISFAFQFDHCFDTAKICKSDIKPFPSGPIANCIEYEEEEGETLCGECGLGYAVSFEKDRCIKSSFCWDFKEGNKICDECYKGYYLKDEKCVKIPIANCQTLLYGDETTCSNCERYSLPINGGKECKIIEPEKLIPGCEFYKDDGTCQNCEDFYTPDPEGNGCIFNGCSEGDKEVEYCSKCEVRYFTDFTDGNCKSFDQSNSNNSKSNKIEFTFFVLLIALLI